MIASFAIVKTRETPLDQRPISAQVQLITLTTGSDRGENESRSLFMMLQQYTRHTFEPLVRLSGSTLQVNNWYNV